MNDTSPKKIIDDIKYVINFIDNLEIDVNKLNDITKEKVEYYMIKMKVNLLESNEKMEVVGYCLENITNILELEDK